MLKLISNQNTHSAPSSHSDKVQIMVRNHVSSLSENTEVFYDATFVYTGDSPDYMTQHNLEQTRVPMAAEVAHKDHTWHRILGKKEALNTTMRKIKRWLQATFCYLAVSKLNKYA